MTDKSKVEKISYDKNIPSCPKLTETNNVRVCETNRPVNHDTINSFNFHELSNSTNPNRPSSYNNPILLSPEQIASEQIVWINRMYAIQMAQYWQSYVLIEFNSIIYIFIIIKLLKNL